MDSSEYKNEAIERKTFSEIFASFIPGWILTFINAVFAYFAAQPGNNNQGQRNAFNHEANDTNVTVSGGKTTYNARNENIPKEAALTGNVGNHKFNRTGGTYTNNETEFEGSNVFAKTD